MPPAEPIAALAVDRATAATMLSVCQRTIDAMIAAGELPAIRMNATTTIEKSGRTYSRARRVLIDVDDLKAWIKRKKETPVAAGAQGGELV